MDVKLCRLKRLGDFEEESLRNIKEHSAMQFLARPNVLCDQIP